MSRRVTLARALACAFGLAACAPEPATLQPFPASVNVVGSATIAFDRLRLVALLQGDGPEDFVLGPDVAITATGTPVQLELTHPADLELESLPFALRLSADGAGTLAARARFVAYQDLDDSGDFQIGEALFGPDRPVGLDEFWRGVAWLADPEEQVSLLSPEAAEGYYRATGDRYTAFVPVEVGANNVLSPDLSGEPILVDVSRHTIANADLACRRRLRNIFDPPPEVLLWVDDSLDAEALCGLELGDCRPVDTSTLTPPTLPDPDIVELNPLVDVNAQCRRQGGVQVLVIEEFRVRCETDTCDCYDVTSVLAVATSTSSADEPEWWPCGEAVEYCPSTQPLYRVDPACFPPPEEDDDE